MLSIQEQNDIVINPQFERFLGVFSLTGEALFSFGALLVGVAFLVRLLHLVYLGSCFRLFTLIPILIIWLLSHLWRRKKLPTLRLQRLLKEFYYIAFIITAVSLVNIVLIVLGVALPDFVNVLLVKDPLIVDEISLIASEFVIMFISLMVVVGFSILAKEMYSGVYGGIGAISKIKSEKLKSFGETAAFFVIFSLSTLLVFYFFGDKLSLLTRNLFEGATGLEAVIVVSPTLFYVKSLVKGSPFVEKGSLHIAEVLGGS